MEKEKTMYVPESEYEAANQVLHHAEDAINKLTAQFFGDELFNYFGIEGEIDYIASTELTHLDLKKYYQDFNYVMKDGSWSHFEFQSTDNGINDLKRFRAYEAVTSHQNNTDVRTYVLYSGNIKNPVTEFTSGFNTYRVQPIIMKGHLAESVFENVYQKMERGILITKEDLVPLLLCPLMDGDMPQKDRVIQAIRIIKQVKGSVPDTDKMGAVIYAMANKFLDEVDMNEVKEEIKMSPLGTLIYNDGLADGIAQGITQDARESARNLFINGVVFELVCASITALKEDELRKIYDEVMAEKNKSVK